MTSFSKVQSHQRACKLDGKRARIACFGDMAPPNVAVEPHMPSQIGTSASNFIWNIVPHGTLKSVPYRGNITSVMRHMPGQPTAQPNLYTYMPDHDGNHITMIMPTNGGKYKQSYYAELASVPYDSANSTIEIVSWTVMSLDRNEYKMLNINCCRGRPFRSPTTGSERRAHSERSWAQETG